MRGVPRCAKWWSCLQRAKWEACPARGGAFPIDTCAAMYDRQRTCVLARWSVSNKRVHREVMLVCPAARVLAWWSLSRAGGVDYRTTVTELVTRRVAKWVPGLRGNRVTTRHARMAEQ
ncbi:hypothetical protein Hdeb2414_s0001g00039061 [Helianthus debilis subsp. tardiflorus]